MLQLRLMEGGGDVTVQHSSGYCTKGDEEQQGKQPPLLLPSARRASRQGCVDAGGARRASRGGHTRGSSTAVA